MTTAPYVLSVLLPEQKEFSLAEKVEADIFKQSFNNSTACMAAEYNPYRSYSKFIAVRDTSNNQIIGVMRLIHDSPLGFKSLTDLEKTPWQCVLSQTLADTGLLFNPSHTIDIATLGIKAGYRAHDGNHQAENWISLALFHGLCRYSLVHHIVHWVTILEEKELAHLQKMAPVFRPYANLGTAEYLGALSVPQWANYQLAVALLKRGNPSLFRQIVEGEGLSGIVDVSSACIS